MIFKKIFKATDTISRRISIPVAGVPIIPTGSTAPIAPTAPVTEPISPIIIDDLQDQIDDITDSIENEYYVDYVFDKYDYFISTKPFYFYFEIPLGTTEIISARVSFEVKDYRNSSLTDSRYAITGDSEARPIITFYVSEDKGCKFGNAYGQYETDMRAIDISGDLTGKGIKIIKFTTDNDVCISARIFLKLKISKKETPDITLLGGGDGGGDGGISGDSQRPEVRTLPATSITGYSATLNGDIIKVGSGNVIDRSTGEITPINTCTKRGFKYATTKADTNNKSETGSFVKGKYGLSIAGLSKNTTYYFRAYAENPLKIFGEYLSFTTSSTGYIISCDNNTNKIYIHDGVTSDISSEFASPDDQPYGLTYDGSNLISCNAEYYTANKNRVYIHSGVTSTVTSSFQTILNMVSGLANCGGNLALCYINNSSIYIHLGFTSTYLDSFVSPSAGPSGLTYDGSNLISCSSYSDKIYIHSGVTSTVTSSFSSPWGIPSGLAYAGSNLISCDSSLEEIYTHDGITSTILDDFASPSSIPTGLTYVNE